MREFFGAGQAAGAQGRQQLEIARPSLLRQAHVQDVATVTSAGNTTLYTVAADNFFYVQDFGVCNLTAGTVALTVYAVESGGSAGTSNTVYYQYPVTANDSGTLTALVGGIFAPGTAFVATCDNATGLNLWLSGYKSIGGDFL